MSKLIRRCAVTGVSAFAAVGALVAVGGPASAATATTPQASPASAHATAGHHPSQPSAGHRHIDSWVAGQIAQFDPAAARRLAVYDPWVKDQLAQFTPGGK
ncbi:hypothetical protein [Streptomyces sp. NPDC048720]|uniref:hypothetical protein n=1 Tax=unclassified Streptomyces TaxID=2593676 RepID=UPI003711475A